VDPETIGRIERAAGARPVSWEPVTHSGFTRNERWRVRLGDGRSAFVKRAIDPTTAGWLRVEHLVYSNMDDAPFLAGLLGWHDEDADTFIVLEDLSDGFWPPPWSDASVASVRLMLDDVHSVTPPAGLPSLEKLRESLSGWHRVRDDPEPFLRLGLASRGWLEASLPALVDASDACVLEGDALVHVDVRSDNICLRDGRARLVDWNWASVGNPIVDVATWLPSLAMEGGPEPEEILPDAPEAAAMISGYFASMAGLPPLTEGPDAVTGQWSRIRALQLAQLGTALPWAARALGLPPAAAPRA
jgi:hypothetical protein